MSYQMSEFSGDETYTINCTGDAVVGDEVRFDRATFTGSFRNPKFLGFERVSAVIIRDSYGREKQQHTFILQLPDGSITRIKGRNLYAHGCFRKPWAEESKRSEALMEKHERGNEAREARVLRRQVRDALDY